MRKIIVGTRQSKLALTQTNWVIKQLEHYCEKHGLPFTFETKKLVTKGDRILDVTLSKVGGKGLFVKEIEDAMLQENIDIAVHSMKDMPFVSPDGLMIGAIPVREDARDCLVMNKGQNLDDLPEGALVGTSSLRRTAQLKLLRPDLKLESIRGNIDTRMNKISTASFDAVVLAAAGLHRMGWKERIGLYLSTDDCIPAVGQGALAIQCRSEDAEVKELLQYIHHQETARVVEAERAFLGKLNGGCQVPLAGYAQCHDDSTKIKMVGFVGSPDGETIYKYSLDGENGLELGEKVAQKLLDQGAEEILREFRG
ncbi:hydroxymethylbilane synthase [Longirhabdus pacifica]|uniref:hydroxymethylbilane synthase n=1 Tax=Longirhabdus pacifica TaxID=2305227 RepID=UPI001008B3BA|nr:hydroxymethylbilane synthase [Longirhabdus pacifica]